MSDITQNLLDTISLMTAHAVSNAQFDRTIQAIIMSCEDEALGIYKVKYQDSIWLAYSNNPETKYSVGTSVYILVPGNNMSKNKTIIGTVSTLGNDYIDYISNEQNYIENGNSIVSITNNKEYGLCSYIEYDKEELAKYNQSSTLEQEENFKLDVNAAREYLSTSEYILLKADFRTDLPKEQRRAGNYGLKVKLKFKTPEDPNKIYEMDYVLDIDNMVGNPYMLSAPLTQKAYFAIDGANFVGVQSIEIFSEGFEHHQTNKPDDIFVSNIEIIGANVLTAQEKDGISLRFKRPKGYIFTASDNSVKTVIAQIRVKNRLLSSTEKVEYYWFKQDITIGAGNQFYSKFGGKGWKCLNTKNTSQATDIKFLPGTDTFTISKSQVAAERTKFKCVALYDNKEISNTFEIINLDSRYIIEMTCDEEPVFYPNVDTLHLTCTIRLRSNNTIVSGASVVYNWRLITEHNTYYTLEEITNVLTIQSESIRNYNDYYCSVYYNGDLIGTATMRVTKNAEPQNRYVLSIVNGTQVFNYDESGNSPCASYLQDKTLTIPQLSFTVIDVVTGFDVTSQAKDVIWSFPQKNTMLVDKNQVEGQIDPQADYREYTTLQNFTYGIADRYNHNKMNNEIKLKVIIHGIQLETKTSFTFTKQGDPGTNGTDIVCKIVATYGAKRMPGWLIARNNNGTKTYNWDKLIVELWQNGERIFANSKSQAANTDTGKPKIGVSWDFLSNQDDTPWYTIAKDSNKQVTTNGIVAFKSGVSMNMTSVDWTSLTTGYPADILKVTVTYGDRNYYDTRPIVTLYNDSSANSNLAFDGSSGFQYVVYSEDGENPLYDDFNPFTVIEPKENIEWSVAGSVKTGYNSFSKLSTFNLDKHTTRNEDNGFEETGNKCYFRPKSTYDGLCVTNAIIAKGTHFWMHIPVHLMYNRYGHKQLNDWDGNSIVMNDSKKNGYILTPQIGAGMKNSDNAFTGLMMGTTKVINKDSDSYTVQTGLLGYNNGERTIFLDATTGKAEFGRAKAGRIVIDPSVQEGEPQALIYGGDYHAPGRDGTDDKGGGMLINLSKPSIEFGSKKFSVDEQKFAVGEDKIIYDVPNNKLSLKLDEFSLRGFSAEQVAKNANNLFIQSLTLSEEYWKLSSSATHGHADPEGGNYAHYLGYDQQLIAKSNNNPFKKKGRTYTFSIWAKTINDNSSAQAQIVFLLGNKDILNANFVPSQEWQKFSHTFEWTSNPSLDGQNGLELKIHSNGLYVYNPCVVYQESQQQIFNRLTNNKASQGIDLVDGQLYVNGRYINSKNLSATNNQGKQTFLIDEDGNVTISPKTFYLEGKTVNQIAKDVFNSYNFEDGNLLKDSKGLTEDYWTLHYGTLVRNCQDPDGGTNAIMIKPENNDEAYVQARIDVNNPFYFTATKYVLTVWLRASEDPLTSGGGPMKLHLNNVASEEFYPTVEWKQYNLAVTVNTVAQANDLVTIAGYGSYSYQDKYSLYIYNPRVTIVGSSAQLFYKLFGHSDGIRYNQLGQLYIGASAISVEDLYALHAKIGGFIIDEDAIRSDTKSSIATRSITISRTPFTREINGTSRSALQFAIGSKFGVSTSGNLYASNGIFEGRIKAREGDLSSFQINDSFLRSVQRDANNKKYYPLKIEQSGTLTFAGIHDTSIGSLTISNYGISTGSSIGKLTLSPYPNPLIMGITDRNQISYLNVYGEANQPSGAGLQALACYGDFQVFSGVKSIVKDTDHYGQQSYYCYETPSPMFGDIGSAQLDENGVCIIALDDIFIESIENTNYQVFLQKYGSGDLWIESKNSTFFTVKGTPKLFFDWEIKAKQKGYSQYRFYNSNGSIPKSYLQSNGQQQLIDELEAQQQSLLENEEDLLNNINISLTETENLLYEELGEVII